MSEFKGTTGKWEVRFMNPNGCNTDNGECDMFIEAQEPKSNIGKIEVLMEDFGEHSGYPREQKLADAKAIAQVPEMVKLLERLANRDDEDFEEIFMDAEDLLTKIL